MQVDIYKNYINAQRSSVHSSETAAPPMQSRILNRIFLMLYLQFAFYWGTIAMGMVVNYYYVVPPSLQPDAASLFLEMVTSPLLLGHVAFAILSTGMSFPIAFTARNIGLKQVGWLHAGAISARMFGFIGGTLFLYFSTSAVSAGTLANFATFLMASAFIVAVILSFMSRIFIVREDVRIKYGSTSTLSAQGRPPTFAGK